MCGIFGYIGEKRPGGEAVREGLERLDYRGYDSWGIATLAENDIRVLKKVGAVPRQKLSLPEADIAIGHTRWATHGSVSDINAHPHFASDGSFVVAQNGIVENFETLKKSLQKKYTFISETDTEVIVHLLEEKLKKHKNMKDAVRAAFNNLTGRNTIIVLTRKGEIFAVRNGSPLVVGRNTKTDELYISSDVLSFAPHVDQVLVLENGHMLAASRTALSLTEVKSGTSHKPNFEKNAIVGSEVSKGKYEHFMLKEIHESPFVLRQLLKENRSALEELARGVTSAKRVFTIGSGTAGAAAAQIAYYLRVYGEIPAVSLIGAEASDYYSLFKKDDLLIAPSQSGETADVLEVLEIAQKAGAKIASFVNMPGSMMTRMSDYPFMAQAGPEICVMSTKIFVSQIAWGYLLAKTVRGKYTAGTRALTETARAVEAFLKDSKAQTALAKVARTYAKKDDLFLIGKGQNTQIIKEGMVKIIEGSYIHAHGIPAGDLKHYAITLMEEGTPVIAVVSNDSVAHDMLNAIHEIKARGAHVLGIAPENSPLFATYIKVPDTKETSAIMNVIPLQLFAYHIALARGNNIDKPRNIAKSVTVK